jgi:hypothetical protein
MRGQAGPEEVATTVSEAVPEMRPWLRRVVEIMYGSGVITSSRVPRTRPLRLIFRLSRPRHRRLRHA